MRRAVCKRALRPSGPATRFARSLRSWLAIFISATLVGGCALQVAGQSNEQVDTTGQGVNADGTAPTPTSGGMGSLGQPQQLMGPSGKPTPNPWAQDNAVDKPTPNPWHPGSADTGGSKVSGATGGGSRTTTTTR